MDRFGHALKTPRHAGGTIRLCALHRRTTGLHRCIVGHDGQVSMEEHGGTWMGTRDIHQACQVSSRVVGRKRDFETISHDLPIFLLLRKGGLVMGVVADFHGGCRGHSP